MTDIYEYYNIETRLDWTRFMAKIRSIVAYNMRWGNSEIKTRDPSYEAYVMYESLLSDIIDNKII